MNAISRNLRPVEALMLCCILAGAALLRCLHLDRFPPFIDESGHILFVNDIHPSFFQIGKVLGQYIFRPVVNASTDPLSAVRLLIGWTGVLTVFGIYLIAKRLTPRAESVPNLPGLSGLIAASIWAFQPLVVFHDRLALHDPLVVAFHVWAIFFSLLAFERDSLPLAVVTGTLCGLAGMVKLPMLVLTGTCILLGLARSPRAQWMSHWRTVATIAVSVLPPFGILWPNRDKFLNLIGNFVAVETVKVSRTEILSENLGLVAGWLIGHNTIWFVLLLAIVVGYTLCAPSVVRLTLLLCCVAPVLALSLTMSVFVSRYVLPFAIPATLLLGLTTPLLFSSLLGVRARRGGSD